MKIVSVILARGGSKGIPGKNIYLIKGKPLISYTINASLNSKVNETWVCTDDSKIAEISKQYGSNVLIRPSNLATDTSPSEDSLLYFANTIDCDFLVFIQPTSPLIETSYINTGIDLILSGTYDSVFSACKEHWIPRWKVCQSKTEPHQWNINSRPRRQDVDELWIENGAFYITSKKMLLETKLRYSGNIGIVEMPMSKSFQIDTYDDLTLIERLI